MARPQKEGLDYFPLDTDIAEDEKILYLEAETGLEGFAIYVKLLSTIYRNSYYMMRTETQLSIYSRRFFVGRIVKLSATPLRNRPHMVFCSQGTS